jgi:hypothetical protein
MKARNLRLGIVFAGLALAATPAFAQSPKEGGSSAGGGAGNTGGGGAGNANAGSTSSGGVASGGGGVVSGGGGSSSSSSSSSSGFGSGGGFSSPSGISASSAILGGSAGGRNRESAPAHRAGYSASNSGTHTASEGEQARPRTNGGSANAGSGGGERAVPRGSASSGSGSNSGANANTRSRTSPTPAAADNNAAGATEVPSWSRPRGGNPATGVATERVGRPPSHNDGGYGGGRYYGSGCCYYDYGYPYYGYGYGGGYYGYGYGMYPYYSWGLGYGLYSGWGWSPYVGDPFDPYYSGSGGYSSGIYNTHDQGSLKLKVKPRNAKVYVDGYFIGLVDQFDGAFQKLALNGGRHKVEVRAEGFETAEFDVLITPDQTVTFQGDLKRIQ